MREIKFRAWDEKGKSMYQITSLHEVNKNGAFTKIDSVLMQYTGLKDKNGKEIYEGDIVEVKERGLQVRIEFHDGCFKGCDYESKARILPELFIDEAVIIGNIYENKELLK